MIRYLRILFLCLPLSLFSQLDTAHAADEESILSINPKDHDLDKKTTSDPKLLVAALTAGKSGDKEKFDAIFGWVVRHISYDYRHYYSGAGSYYIPAWVILKNRRAICQGYANLMDTLCGHAGITNTTVYGYAKDHIFDVHDSIYIDNHAWNAVKLDGLWYVYDITWSTGHAEFEPTRLSKFVNRFLEKHPKKYKKKKLRNRFRRLRDGCPHDAAGPAFYYKQRWLNRLLRGFLARYAFRTKLKYQYKINTNFYLAQPEVFAITHYPDDAIWALGANMSIHKFENDSAFYYLDGQPYPTQIREGRECTACNEYTSLNEKEKQKVFATHGSAFNPKNQFLSFENQYLLGWMNQRATFAEMPDSVKLVYLDSAGVNYAQARAALMKGLRNVAVEHILQKRKNKKKMQLLMMENRQHKNFIRSRLHESMNGQRTWQEIENKCYAFGNSYWDRKVRMERYRTGFKTYRKELTKKIIQKMGRLQSNQEKLDILYRQLSEKKSAFDSVVANLSLNVWQQARGLDTLSKYFYDRTKLRSLRKDNYKRTVEEVRKKINKTEFYFGNSLNFQVFEPARDAAKLFDNICKLIKLKNKLEYECMNLQRDLVKVEHDPMSDLEELRAKVVSGLHDDYCWLKSRYPQASSTRRGLRFLQEQQLEVDMWIMTENHAERYRHYRVNEENKARYQQRRDIGIANKQGLRDTVRNWKKYRARVARKRKR